MKKLLYAVIALILVVAVVVFIGVSNIGPIIKNAVNTYGPEITGTAVNIDDVSVSLLSGTAKLNNFLLGNPKGFTSDKAIEIGAIKVDIDEKSITKDTIIIDSIAIEKPSITYERKSGTDNFNAILRNIEKRTSSADKGKSKKSETKKEKKKSRSKEDGKSKGSETKLFIKDFSLTNGKVSLVTSLLKGKSIDAKLPDIHLTNIGSDGSGVTAREAMKIIMDAIYKNIQAPDVTEIFNANLKDLGADLQSLGKSLGKGKQKDISKVTDKLKGLFGKKK